MDLFDYWWLLPLLLGSFLGLMLLAAWLGPSRRPARSAREDNIRQGVHRQPAIA